MTDERTDAARAAAEQLLGAPIVAIEPLGGGRNSRVYRVVGADNQPRALKAYFRHGPGSRDRLQAEFAALEFLWRHGVRDVPEPLAADRQAGYALYAFVEGRKVPADELTAADIDAAVAFLRRLKDLAGRRESGDLPRASEACFSGPEFVANLEGRLDRLMRPAAGADAIHPDLHAFLRDEFLPALERMVAAASCHDQWNRELPRAHRTLSPSDFGFHNALQSTSGDWMFLDFEHFGWDDPSKLICDFLLHPAMPLAPALRRRFVERLRPVFAYDPLLTERLGYHYPLFALKWCTILLNEFVSEDAQRRRFAATADTDDAALLARQLAKARRMLALVSNHDRPDALFE